MDWEHPDEKTSETQVCNTHNLENEWRNQTQSNLGGNDEDWFTRRNFKR